MRQIQKYFLLSVALCLFSFPSSLLAQNFSEGSRALGMGGSYTGVATGVDGIYHNPAGIAHAIMYNIGGRYSYTPSGNVLNASIVDSKTNPNLAAGVSYSYFDGNSDDDKTIAHDIRAAVAIPALPEKVSMGLGGRLLVAEAGGVEFMNGITLDAGILFEPSEHLRLGFAGQNLIDICSKAQKCQGVAPRIISGGFSFGDSQIFLLNGDLSADLTSASDVQVSGQLGAEYQIAGAFPVRIGYEYRQLNRSNYLGGGLGWRSSQAGVDVGYRHNVNNSEKFEISTTISLYF